MKVSSKKERRMAKECCSSMMAVIMKEKYIIMIFMAKAPICGRMGGTTKGIGSITKCRARESLHGQMERNMKESIMMIIRMVMECSYGLIRGSMKVNGLMESRMGEAPILIIMGKQSKENG